MKKSIKLLTAFAFATLTAIHPVHAGSHTWSGAFSSSWNNNANWSAGGAPLVGEAAPVILIFPPNPVRLGSTNTISNLQVDDIAITGANYQFGAPAGITPLKLRANAFGGLRVFADGNSFYLPLELVGEGNFVVTSSHIFEVWGALSGQGSLSKLGSGYLYLRGSTDNTASGTHRVSEGTLRFVKIGSAIPLSGQLIVGDTNAASPSADVVFDSSDQHINLDTITVNQTGTVHAGSVYQSHFQKLLMTGGAVTAAPGGRLGFFTGVTVPYLAGGAPQIVSAATLRSTATVFDIATNAYLRMENTVDGNTPTDGLKKTGAGTLTLNANNTYTGITKVQAGTLNILGSQPGSPVVVEPGSRLQVFGATLGTLTVNGGTVSVGYDPNPATCKSLILDVDSTCEIDISGTTPGSAYSQLNVTGLMALEGGKLNLWVAPAFAPVVGASFTIIRNDLADAVAGTFQNLPEGTTFAAAGRLWQITYLGGTGNDVVLTHLGLVPPLQISSVTKLANGQMQLTGTGGAGLSYDVQANANLNTPNWSKIGTIQADANGLISFTDTNAASFPMRFYRFKGK